MPRRRGYFLWPAQQPSHLNSFHIIRSRSKSRGNAPAMKTMLRANFVAGILKTGIKKTKWRGKRGGVGGRDWGKATRGIGGGGAKSANLSPPERGGGWRWWGA